MTLEYSMKVWLKANAEQCEKFAREAGMKGNYKDAIELEGMAKAFKKAAIKVDQLKN